ncbi:MAG TPA: DUF5655 domain-containing protein [Candidatus Deferrimicrobium sp.]|nr:DUF5655 domain-containing protein [Candidatus Deferrimicrobium sp.]
MAVRRSDATGTPSRLDAMASPARLDSAVMEAAAFFTGHPLGLAVHERVRSVLDGLGPVTVRVTKSQVAFRRRRAFAWLWLPGRYLTNPTADVVLSFALGRRDGSPRIKEIVQPSPRHWMHHLEVRQVADIDDEVVAWLREAADRAD